MVLKKNTILIINEAQIVKYYFINLIVTIKITKYKIKHKIKYVHILGSLNYFSYFYCLKNNNWEIKKKMI